MFMENMALSLFAIRYELEWNKHGEIGQWFITIMTWTPTVSLLEFASK